MPTFKSYVTGFTLSLALTLAAFFVVIRPGFFRLGSAEIVAAIITLALSQFFVQITFFLHLWRKPGPSASAHAMADKRWNVVVFASTIGIVLILVVGSLWIMNHLNYNMTPQDINDYMLKSEGIMQ